MSNVLEVGAAAVRARQQPSDTGGMRRAWDDLARETLRWEAVLEREGLGVIAVGPDEKGHGRKDIVSLTPALEARVTGSVWDLSATVDTLVDALGACRFDSLVDGQICEMLSRRVPWHRIARTLRCSKRRVGQVSRIVEVWRQQAADILRRRAQLAEVVHG